MENLKNLVLASAFFLKQPELIYEIISIQKEENKKLNDFISLKGPFDCSAGCWYCCKNWLVKGTIPELLLIAKKLNTLPIELRISIAKKLEDFAGAKNYTETLCPFLINNLCIVYEERPLICRLYTSKNKNLCKENQEIPLPPFIESIMSQIKTPLENKIEEPFKALFKTSAPIHNIKFDFQKNIFYLNIANAVKIILLKDQIITKPLDYARKYMNF